MAENGKIPSVAVVVPIYQYPLAANELISLRQCFSILKNYPILVAKPQSLDLEPLREHFPFTDSMSFDDGCFAGIGAYNRLLVSIDFYKSFTAFEYILIYQLDAFVFRDELAMWCNKGYDYIGSPSLHEPEFDALKAESHTVLASALSTRRYVLNGGLSLRRVPSFLRYLRIHDLFYPAWPGNEDMLFSQAATRLGPMKWFLKTPPWQEALHFSFEKSPAAEFELTGRQLPFACHAWERYDPAFWATYISFRTQDGKV